MRRLIPLIVIIALLALLSAASAVECGYMSVYSPDSTYVCGGKNPSNTGWYNPDYPCIFYSYDLDLCSSMYYIHTINPGALFPSFEMRACMSSGDKCVNSYYECTSDCMAGSDDPGAAPYTPCGEDEDNDGHYSGYTSYLDSACPLGPPPDDWHPGVADCDDENPDVWEPNPEVCDDGIDNDCDCPRDSEFQNYGDSNRDGIVCGIGDYNIDCCDMECRGGGGMQVCYDGECVYQTFTKDPYCEKETICNDGLDNDCDGRTDCCEDPDCQGEPECGTEICDDGVDNECDGLVDCCDDDCLGDSACLEGEGYPGTCTDGLDNDCDGQEDCCDDDCSETTACTFWEYAAASAMLSGTCTPREICDNCVDDDGDGKIDCGDRGDCCNEPMSDCKRIAYEIPDVGTYEMCCDKDFHYVLSETGKPKAAGSLVEVKTKYYCDLCSCTSNDECPQKYLGAVYRSNGDYTYKMRDSGCGEYCSYAINSERCPARDWLGEKCVEEKTGVTNDCCQEVVKVVSDCSGGCSSYCDYQEGAMETTIQPACSSKTGRCSNFDSETGEQLMTKTPCDPGEVCIEHRDSPGELLQARCEDCPDSLFFILDNTKYHSRESSTDGIDVFGKATSENLFLSYNSPEAILKKIASICDVCKGTSNDRIDVILAGHGSPGEVYSANGKFDAGKIWVLLQGIDNPLTESLQGCIDNFILTGCSTGAGKEGKLFASYIGQLIRPNSVIFTDTTNYCHISASCQYYFCAKGGNIITYEHGKKIVQKVKTIFFGTSGDRAYPGYGEYAYQTQLLNGTLGEVEISIDEPDIDMIGVVENDTLSVCNYSVEEEIAVHLDSDSGPVSLGSFTLELLPDSIPEGGSAIVIIRKLKIDCSDFHESFPEEFGPPSDEFMAELEIGHSEGLIPDEFYDNMTLLHDNDWECLTDSDCTGLLCPVDSFLNCSHVCADHECYVEGMEPGPAPPPPPPTGPLLYMPFESPDPLEDHTGNHEVTEVFGDPGSTEGIIGEAYAFDGDDYLQTSLDPSSLTQLSIDYYVNFDEVRFSKRPMGTEAFYWSGILFNIDIQNRLEFTIRNDQVGDNSFGIAGDLVCKATSPLVLRPGQWYRVTALWDGTQCTLDVAGQTGTSQKEPVSTTILPGTLNLGFGNNANAHLNGALDEVYVYDIVIPLPQCDNDGVCDSGETEATCINDCQLPGPILYMPFEAPNYMKADGFDGTPTGDPGPTTGVVGDAYAFDGDDYLSTPLELNDLDQITFDLYANFDQATPYANMITNKFAGVGLSLNYEGKVYFTLSNEANQQFCSLTSDVAPRTGQWYRIVATFDGEECALDVGGVVATAPAGPATGTFKSGNVYLAFDPRNQGNELVGTLDEVYIHDHALPLPPCDNDGVCDEREDQYSCSNDCAEEDPLRFYMPFEAPEPLKDVAGGYDGTPVGDPGPTSGHSGQAYSFNGDDYITTTLQLTDFDELTIDLYVNFDEVFTGETVINTKYYTGGIALSDNKFDFMLVNNTNQRFCRLISGLPVEAGVWHHVIATFDGETCSLLVDGHLDTQPALGATGDIKGGPVYLGFHPSVPKYNLKGLLDEVEIYDHAIDLSPFLSGVAGAATGRFGPLSVELMLFLAMAVVFVALLLIWLGRRK